MTIPDPNLIAQDAIERAKRLGTYDKIDRRIQYQGPERARPEALLEAVNSQGNHIRALQRHIDTLQSQLKWARWKNTLLVAILGGASAKGIEVAVLAIIHAVSH